MSSSFDSPIPIHQIRDGDRIELVASAEERSAIADRLGLGSIECLKAHADLSRSGNVVRARGRLQAALTQDCVVTGEAIAVHPDEPFAIEFLPLPGDSQEQEIELEAKDCDTVFHDGSSIDLGGAIADSLALSLDPYPRSAGAEAALKEAGVMSEGEAGPFAVLARLKNSGSKPD